MSDREFHSLSLKLPKSLSLQFYSKILISALFAPLVFLGGFHSAMAGVVLWGIGMGSQESIMRASISRMIPVERRGAGYGIFNLIYGLFWFLGSAAMGILYDLGLLACS